MKKNMSENTKHNKQEIENQEDNNQEIETIDESENNEDRHGAEHRRSVLRIVAGGYLIYLSYSGITDILEEVDLSTPWYFYLIYGAFAIIGALLVFDGVRSQIKNKK